MKLLIFTGSSKRAKELAAGIGGVFMVDDMSQRAQYATIHYFNDREDCTALVSTKCGILGWAAPKDTVVLFDGDVATRWSKPEVTQAKMRAR